MRTLLTTLAAAASGLALGAGVGVAVAAPDAATARQAGMDAMHAEMVGVEGMHGDMADMDAMHEAITPEAMDAMHDRMVAALPEELRAQADEMHARMGGHMAGGMGARAADHGVHHPAAR